MAGALARCAFDAVTVDMQHGAMTEMTAFASMRIIHSAQASLGCMRIPVGRNDLASRALDMGFEAVIAPMINTVADAQDFADSMKYPPVGEAAPGGR
jgi:4-hydroxy-2-oxoheptanedioate aldolase